MTGLLLREDGDSVILVDLEGRQTQIALGDIEARRRLLLSPMPTELSKKIAPADFDHLLGYLLSQREPQSAPTH